MVFSFLYLAVRAVLGALVRSRRDLHVKMSSCWCCAMSSMSRPLPDPRPRQQVQLRLRRSLSQRRHPDCEDTDTCAEGERDRRTLRQNRTQRMSRLAADPHPPPPRTRVARLRRPLQHAEAASRTRSRHAGSGHAQGKIDRGRDPPPRQARRPHPRVPPSHRMRRDTSIGTFRRVCVVYTDPPSGHMSTARRGAWRSSERGSPVLRTAPQAADRREYMCPFG